MKKILAVVLLSLFITPICAGIARAMPVESIANHPGKPVQQSSTRAADTVLFNTNSHKYHAPGCQWAKRCTANCISVSRQEALKRGGIPCKVCGGG